MKSALMAGMQAAGLDDVELAQYAAWRYRDLRTGREGTDWWSKREKYERVAASDLAHRLSADPLQQTIFDKAGNNSLQLIRSVRKFLVARTWKDLFGSAPYFTAKPKPGSGSGSGSGGEGGMGAASVDPALVEQIQPHAEFKLEEAGYKAFGKQAIGVAMDLGECAMKTTYKTDDDISERLAIILWDSKAKSPVVTADGDYIYEDDEAAEAPVVDELGAPLADEATGEPMPGRTFAKAPEIVWQPSFEWKEHLVEEKVRLFTGIHVSTCYWKDIFWDINKPSLEESDVIHRYDRSLSDLTATYNPDGDNPDVQAALDLLQSDNNQPKSEAALAKRELGEPEVSRTDTKDPTILIGEFYMDCDVFKDGVKRRIHLVMALDHDLIIWAEYRAAMSPLAQKPIHMLAINKVEGRAYGRGVYEMFEDASEAMDKLLNSIMYRNSYNADPVKIWNPGKTTEGDTDPHLRFAPGKTYQAKGQANANEILQIIELPDLDDRTWMLMQLYMQLVQVESGVTNAAQAAVSQLEQNKTATGTNALTEVSSVLHLYILEELKDGFQPQLKYTVELIYFRQDADDSYADGGPDGQKVLALADAQRLSNLPMQVEIVLTRVKRQEMREAAVAAIPIVDAFYDKLAMIPALQAIASQWKIEKTQPLYVQVLRGFEIDNADNYFPSLDEIKQAIVQFEQAMAQQAQTAGLAPAGDEVPALPSNVIPGPPAASAPVEAVA